MDPSTCDRTELDAVLREQLERWRSGERPSVADLVQSRPGLRQSAGALRELIEQEVTLRQQGGETPDLSEYSRQFPELNAAQPFSLPTNASQGRTVGVPPPGASPLERPEIPGYEAIQLLGRGGCAVVWEARQIKLNRRVALKIDATADGRLEVEPLTLARLQHPNIVPVYDVGRHLGRAFFAMELLPGGSLADRLAGKPLAPRQAAEYAEVLARAVQFAHERQVIHRDLKPGNVFLTAEGILKIGDFGLAKQLDAQLQATLSNAVLGTPSYMAPEQARGAKELTTAVDVYALGGILYAMLTGRPPFLGASPIETIQLVFDQEPAAPRLLQPSTPRDLETICLKCLDKDPQRRYASAAALAEDLRRFLDGQPIQARRAGPLERAAKWARRRPAEAALVGFGLFVILAMIAAGVFYQIDARRRQLLAERCLALGIRAQNDFDAGVFLRADGQLATAQQTLRQALESWQEVRAAYPDAVAVLPELARCQHQLGWAYQDQEAREKRGFDAAVAHYDQAIALWKEYLASGQAPPRTSIELAKSYNNLGNTYRDSGQLEPALRQYRLGMDLLEAQAVAASQDAEGLALLGIMTRNWVWAHLENEKPLEGADRALRQAIAHINRAIAIAREKNTGSGMYRVWLALNRSVLCEYALRRPGLPGLNAELDAYLAAIRDVGDLWERARMLREAAGYFARGAARLREEGQPDAAARTTQAEELLGRAVGCLREALTLDPSAVSFIMNIRDYQPLHGRPDFETLLREFQVK